MPPIAYFNVVRGKDPLLKYETRYHMVIQASGRASSPPPATMEYHGTPSGKWLRATDRITCPA